MQDRLLASDDKGMACIMPPLETNDTLGVIGQPIYDLAFALIAPLSANDYDILLHGTVTNERNREARDPHSC